MKAKEIDLYLKSLGNVPEKTVDRLICGDPESEVTGIGVCWMPYIHTIKDAERQGLNVMVVHEPTFYTHWDLQGKAAYPYSVAAKRQLIENIKITIIRCHDIWDCMPDVGITAMWGGFLRLGTPLVKGKYLHVYEIAPQRALDFAKRIAGQASALGQEAVGLYGDPDRQVKKIGIGAGCICDVWELYKMGAELAILADDAVRAWEGGEWCNDTGFPAIVVNHAVSEIPAMISLADQLRAGFPGIRVVNIAQRSSYMTVINAGCVL